MAKSARNKFHSANLPRLREERKGVRLTDHQLRVLEDFRDFRSNPSIEHLREELGSDFFTNLTLDAQHKRLLASYTQEGMISGKLVNMATAADFKLHRAMALSGFQDLPDVTEMGDYKGDDLEDEARGTYQVTKRGRIFGLSLEAQANDELAGFSRKMSKFGQAAARTVEKFVITTNLDANPTIYDGLALVHTTHGNKLGTSKPLNMANVKAAMVSMRSQTGIKTDEKLIVTPKYLICHTDDEFTARELVESSRLIIAGGTDTVQGDANTLKGKLEVLATPFVTTGRWWVAADPSMVDTFELAFWRGQSAPELFTEPPGSAAEFDRDVQRWKVRHIFGGAWNDWRGIVGANF